jgi:hypothetical protein
MNNNLKVDYSGLHRHVPVYSAFLILGEISIKNIITQWLTFISNNIDTILNISLLISCVILYINIPKVIKLLLGNKENKKIIIENWIKRFKYVFWFLFISIFSFFSFDYLYPELFPLNTTSYVSRRTLKFTLAIILNISNIYINVKTNGLKSWKTVFSIFSLVSTVFIMILFFNSDLRNNVSYALLKLMQWGLALKILWKILTLPKEFADLSLEPIKVLDRPSIVDSEKEGLILTKSGRDHQEVKKKAGYGDRTRYNRWNWLYKCYNGIWVDYIPFNKPDYRYPNKQIEKQKESILKDRKEVIEKEKGPARALHKTKVKERTRIERENMRKEKYKRWEYNKSLKASKRELHNANQNRLNVHKREIRNNKIRNKIYWSQDRTMERLKRLFPGNLIKWEIMEDHRKKQANSWYDRSAWKKAKTAEEVKYARENAESLDDSPLTPPKPNVKERKYSRVKHFYDARGKKTFYKKFNQPSYIYNGKSKILPDNPHIRNILTPANYINNSEKMKRLFITSSPSRLQTIMFAKKDERMPKVIPEKSNFSYLPNYEQTLKGARHRELVLLRLILLRITYFPNEFPSVDLISQLIQVQSNITELEKQTLSIEGIQDKEKKGLKKIEKKKSIFKLTNLFNFSKKTPISEIIQKQEYTYYDHPSEIVPGQTKATQPEPKDYPYKTGKDGKLDISPILGPDGKQKGPALPKEIEYDPYSAQPPMLILTSHEDIYNLYYGPRKWANFELEFKEGMVITEITMAYREREFENWKKNFKAWALCHYEPLSSISQHYDFKKIASEHDDYLWLHTKYKVEIKEMAEEYEAINKETNESKKRTKNENENKIRENQPLPPIPIIINKDLPEIPSEDKNLVEGSIKENRVEIENVIDEEYLPNKKSENIISQKESDKKIANDESNKEIIKKEDKFIDFEWNDNSWWGLKPEDVKNMTAKELEIAWARQLAEKEKRHRYFTMENARLVKNIAAEKDIEVRAYGDVKYTDFYDCWTPTILRQKKWQEYYDTNAYRLKADYYNLDRIPEPVECSDSESDSDKYTESLVSYESDSEDEAGSVTRSKSDNRSLKNSSKESIKNLNSQESSTPINKEKEPEVYNRGKIYLGENEEDISRDIIAPPKPVLKVTYTPDYYRYLRDYGEDHMLTEGTASYCRRIALERHKQALELWEKDVIRAEEMQRWRLEERGLLLIEKEKERQKLRDNGIDPDNPDAPWVNKKALETVGIAVIERALGGINYKVKKINSLIEWHDNAIKLRITLAESWERDFHGGDTKEKLDKDFHEEVQVLHELQTERSMLTDIYGHMEEWKEYIKRQQAQKIYGRKFTQEQEGDLDDDRIFWIQNIIDNPNKQEEIVNYLKSYMKNINENKVSKEYLAHADIVEYVNEYINVQKPGLLNLKPFKDHKPDVMTVKYIDNIIDDYRVRLEKRDQERMERAKKERADIYAYLNRPLLRSLEELREGIEEDKKWLAERKKANDQLKKEIAEEEAKAKEKAKIDEEDW